MAYFSKMRLLLASVMLLVVAGCNNKKVKLKSFENAVSTQETIAENYDSGKDRILQITHQIKHDLVPAHTKQLQYAQVKNIDHDLNIEKIAQYFDCKTVMGHAFLIETLKQPIAAVDHSSIILHRQTAIAKLVENPEFKEEVVAVLQVAAQQEKQIIQLMSDYFIGKTCPELANLALLKEQKSSLYPVVEFCNTHSSMKTALTALNIFGLIFMPVASISLGVAAYQNAQMGLKSGELAFWSGYFGLLTGVYAYLVHDDFSKAAEKRKKIHALNQLIYVAEAIEKLCDKYDVENQFKMSLIQDKQGAELVKQLKHNRYRKKQNYCFHTAGVHAFLYKIYQNDKHLAQLFASIAEMDAYNAIANKMIASQHTSNKICFAEFIVAEKPKVKATALWNVLIPHAVTNSLAQEQHIILTGPNAGGKTTAIRAMLQNIILAQSYGVAAAETFAITPFDVIFSYLNISDDLVRGDSLFASEIKRAQEILQTIQSLSSHQKMFFALDELFTGTAAQEGEMCAYEFIKKIATYNHVLSIYATHFNLLKDLGNSSQTLINYKVDAPIKNDEHKLIYPYTLSPGASDVCVALDMAREAHLFA